MNPAPGIVFLWSLFLISLFLIVRLTGGAE